MISIDNKSFEMKSRIKESKAVKLGQNGPKCKKMAEKFAK